MGWILSNWLIRVGSFKMWKTSRHGWDSNSNPSIAMVSAEPLYHTHGELDSPNIHSIRRRSFSFPSLEGILGNPSLSLENDGLTSYDFNSILGPWGPSDPSPDCIKAQFTEGIPFLLRVTKESYSHGESDEEKIAKDSNPI